MGQILDYAKELASWNYEKLQSSVSQALGEKGSVLYELVRERHPETDEAIFVDNVARYLKRGEFLLLILGDGIRKEVEEIVSFVQKHSGLHFDLALVEVAVWRDGARLLVQPRVLMRTKIVRRTVVEGGLEQDAGAGDYTEDTLSDQEEENLRFWTAVTNDYAFSDDTVESPVIDGTTLFVKVRNSGFSGWALQFTGSLSRKPAGLRCYLTCRKGYPHEDFAYNTLVESIAELREETGADIKTWNDGGRPRPGFRREDGVTFPVANAEDKEFAEAVSWMRERLNILVSTLNPKIQRLLADRT